MNKQQSTGTKRPRGNESFYPNKRQCNYGDAALAAIYLRLDKLEAEYSTISHAFDTLLALDEEMAVDDDIEYESLEMDVVA